MEQRTEVQIELTPSRVIQLRYRLFVVNSDEVEISSQFVRDTVHPGQAVDDALAKVGDYLARQGFPNVSVADADRIRAVVAIEHTPEVIAAFLAANRLTT